MVEDGHQPNSMGLDAPCKRFLLKVGGPTFYATFDHGTYDTYTMAQLLRLQVAEKFTLTLKKVRECERSWQVTFSGAPKVPGTPMTNKASIRGY